jgi:hypothetical protein
MILSLIPIGFYSTGTYFTLNSIKKNIELSNKIKNIQECTYPSDLNKIYCSKHFTYYKFSKFEKDKYFTRKKTLLF